MTTTTASPSRAPDLGQYRRIFGRYLRPLWRSVSGMAALILTGIVLQLALPLVMRRFIDGVQAGAALNYLLLLGAVYLAAAIIQQVINVAATYVSENVGWRATNDLRTDLAGHLLRLDLSFHNAHSPGEMIERVDGDVTTLSNFFSRFAVQIVGNLVLMLGIVVLLFGVDWRVGIVIGGFITLTLGLLARFRNLAVPYWKAERQASAELFGFLEERLAGTEDIRANGGKGYVMNRFYSLMRELLRRSLKAAFMINVLLNMMIFSFAAGTAAAFAVGAYLFLGGAISLGTVYLIFQYTNMLQRPIEEISRQMQDFQKAGAGLSRVSELLDVRSVLDAAPGAHASAPLQPGTQPVGAGTRAGQGQGAHAGAPLQDLPPVGADAVQRGLRDGPAPALSVTFDNVVFAYPDSVTLPGIPAGDADDGDAPAASPDDTPAPDHVAGEIVLDGVSFHLPAGAVLGLLGRTGSGKTTLTRLLFRLYDPNQGDILICPDSDVQSDDGVCNLRDLPLADLRRRIGMIPQNVQLFNAPVRDNLTFFDPSIPDERVLRAVHDLGLGGWLETLPNGLDTVLESGGSGLSAGQAQLLAFARIFLRDPGLVILDEASSRLDPATEAWIETAIDRLVRGRTAVIVAHRLGTVQRADWILVLDGGRILEFGPRAALAADPSSHFHHLLEAGLEEVLV